MHIVNLEKVPLEPLEKPGAQKVMVRRVFGRKEGAQKFFLRCYYVEKGGCTPVDKHSYEHGVYIVSGEGLLKEGERDNTKFRELHPGDAVFIASNEVHQFLNAADEPLVLLCVRGASELYEDRP